MIRTAGLTKKYGAKTAVDGLDLHIREGELFSLLGVNGAGKTTTIRMLSCLSKPTSGEAFVGGFSVKEAPQEVKQIIGISTQDTAVAERLTVRENLQFMASLHYTDKDRIRECTEEMINVFRFEEVENQLAKTLSGGWQRKLSIAMALIGDPKVLFLDEPTLGLDVLARRELWKMIERIKEHRTIILTTHYMEEAEALSDRIAILQNGRLRALGTLSEIEEMAGVKGLENAFVKIAGEEDAR
ncbi:MAG: ATP-binding cassette domain-containing protein [Lachnospiraceae bacterium]|nr:ATP-binding cassette domain-containing protein [Lachnospiraceae bacterium]